MGKKQWGEAAKAVAKARSAPDSGEARLICCPCKASNARSRFWKRWRDRRSVPLTRLTEILGIDPSSVFRLANTLKRRGFLANPNGRKHYVLGPAVWRLSREYDWSRMLISSCRESVKALAARTGETAHLAVREGREVFFIDHHASGDQGVIVPGQTGKLMPLHCTAHGKSLLADFGLEELKALFGSTPLERYTARTRVSLPELAKACAQVRADGCSVDDGRYLEDVRCVAAPVRDRGGLVIGSIGVSAPATRMSKGRTPCWRSTSVTPLNTSTRCSARRS